MKKITLAIPFCAILLFACNTSTDDTNKNSQNVEMESTSKSYDIDPHAFQKAINANSDIQILDVRTPEEYSGGSINGAVNINIYDDDYVAQIAKLDKSKPVYVYCKSGGRSDKAAKQLKELGFGEVYSMKGGLMNWENEGLPLASNNTAPVTHNNSTESYDLSAYEQMIKEKQNVIIDFYAQWCGPCKLMTPVLEELEKSSNGKFVVVKVDIDKSKDLAKHFNITSIPYLKIYKNGEQVEEVLGFNGDQLLKKQINALF